jgi:hypothetical protein
VYRGRFEGDRVSGLPVLESSRVAAFLVAREGELRYEVAGPVLGRLEAMVR